MQIRIWALYHGSSRVLTFMLITFFSEVIAMTTIFTLLVSGTVVVSAADTCVFVKVPNLGVIFWVPSLIFETLLLSLAGFTGFMILWRTRRWNMNRLIHIFMRDNILYFLCTITAYLITAILLLKISPVLDNIPNAFTITLTCILGSRLMLNLRDASYNSQITGTEDSSQRSPHHSASNRATVGSARSHEPTQPDVENGRLEHVIHLDDFGPGQIERKRMHSEHSNSR